MINFTISPDEINALYEAWFASQDPVLYDKLLQAVMDTIYSRYEDEGKAAAENISMMVAAKIFRALPGYSGPRPLKPYDNTRGKFHGFVSTMARTTRLDYKRKQARQSHVVYRGLGIDLEHIHARLQNPWSSEGRKRTNKLPIS